MVLAMRSVFRNAVAKLSTAPAPKKSTNWLLTIGVPTALVGGIYYYSTTIPRKEADALNPNEWKAFKLKEVPCS